MLEKPRIDIQIDKIYQSRHTEQESSLKSYVEQLPSLLISVQWRKFVTQFVSENYWKTIGRSFVLFRSLPRELGKNMKKSWKTQKSN